MTETLRDSYGRKLGTLEDNGREVVLRDGYGRKLGTYDKQSNTTRDDYGRKIGTGNLLAALLKPF